MICGPALADQALSEKQMDMVTAGGFSAFSTSLAESYGSVTTATTTNYAEVSVLRSASGTPDSVVVNGGPLNQIEWVPSISTAVNLPTFNPFRPAN